MFIPSLSPSPTVDTYSSSPTNYLFNNQADIKSKKWSNTTNVWYFTSDSCVMWYTESFSMPISFTYQPNLKRARYTFHQSACRVVEHCWRPPHPHSFLMFEGLRLTGGVRKTIFSSRFFSVQLSQWILFEHDRYLWCRAFHHGLECGHSSTATIRTLMTFRRATKTTESKVHLSTTATVYIFCLNFIATCFVPSLSASPNTSR